MTVLPVSNKVICLRPNCVKKSSRNSTLTPYCRLSEIHYYKCCFILSKDFEEYDFEIQIRDCRIEECIFLIDKYVHISLYYTDLMGNIAFPKKYDVSVMDRFNIYTNIELMKKFKGCSNFYMRHNGCSPVVYKILKKILPDSFIVYWETSEVDHKKYNWCVSVNNSMEDIFIEKYPFVDKWKDSAYFSIGHDYYYVDKPVLKKEDI